MSCKKLSHTFTIPADVPPHAHHIFVHNYHIITKNSSRLFVFSCDQKIEHLNSIDPEIFFRIAQHGTIGALATHEGLIARYAQQYPDIPYIVKLNAKTNLIPTAQHDPQSALLTDIEQVVALAETNKFMICGVGITVYVGSEHEPEMLSAAAHLITQAHEYGLVAIVWAYPRGTAITDEQNPALIAGAAGIACSLGADFAKIKPPHAQTPQDPYHALAHAIQSAGNTKVICSGGTLQSPEQFLTILHQQLTQGHTAGCAIGRNIFERPLHEAIAMTHAIHALVYHACTAEKAIHIYKDHAKKS